MISVTMCFSILQIPRFRTCALVHLWSGNLHGWTQRFSTSSKLQNSVNPKPNEAGSSKKWSKNPVRAKSDTNGKAAWSSKASSIRREVFEASITSTTAALDVNGETEISRFQKGQCCDMRQDVAKDKEKIDPASLVTVIVFDIETTGFSREKERIIEIAFQDLGGGEKSTFQTLINPERHVANSHIHGITSHMVNRPEVPRMVDLIPILLQYIKSRQKLGGQVLLVAHNARGFDVPFLIHEFNRCLVEMPKDWIFLDTLALARESMKSGALKLTKASVQALCEYFSVPSFGTAHRAMSDVKCLSVILQRICFMQKLSLSNLLERSFTASELVSQKSKKSSG